MASPASRHPLLWAALAYAAGTVGSANIWRPAKWWFATVLVFLVAATFWTRKRPRWAQTFVLLTLASLAMVASQLRWVSDASPTFPEDAEVVVSAHVVAAGEVIRDSRGGFRQRADVTTEDATLDDATKGFIAGLRLNLFAVKTDQVVFAHEMMSAADAADVIGDAATAKFPELHYGEGVRFPARLRVPRNYHNPGAFDYVGYLAAKGISATASVRVDKLQRLQGFTGNRWELLRTRMHSSIIAMIHKLWSPEQAPLIDAMVIGDDAFVNQDTRADFQRSGTYHILVVSGMNVGILAFVSFWTL